MARKAKNIVLLHGWGASVTKLHELGNELKKLGWHVFLPKLPGFDLKHPDKSWSLSDYVEFIEEESHKVFKDESFFVFGHSFGGRVAIKMGTWGKSLAGVILCAAGGLSRGNLLKRAVFFVLAKLGKILKLYPPAASFWKKLIYELAREHDYEKTSGVMKTTFKNVVSENLKAQLSTITVPTLILWGKEDKITPVKDAYFIKRVNPKSSLIIFEKEGHRLPYDRSKEVSREIDKWFQTLH